MTELEGFHCALKPDITEPVFPLLVSPSVYGLFDTS